MWLVTPITVMIVSTASSIETWIGITNASTGIATAPLSASAGEKLIAAHAVHHASRPPTAWAAMSFHPLEALTGAVVMPALVFLIPIHVAALGFVLGVMTVMGVTNHMGWDVFPAALTRSRLGGWLITASHHQRHHHLYAGNYGLYFRHWDRWCGTDRGLVAAR